MNKMLEKITNFYLNSSDFNGVPLMDLGKDPEKVRRVLRNLLKKDKIVLNLGDYHPNSHILAFEPEPKEQQIEQLNKLEFTKPEHEDYGVLEIQENDVVCCVYPSKNYLRTVVKQKEYAKTPFTLLLALGEPQLSYRAFNLRVLDFYRKDPRYSFFTDDIRGSISLKSGASVYPQDSTFLQSFSFAYSKDLKKRYVAVYLRYLSNLTPEHQNRWKLDEISEETFLHSDYVSETRGDWPEAESLFVAFLEEIKIINKMAECISGKPLFRDTYAEENKPTKFGFLIQPTCTEYEEFVQLLDKMIIDNLNRKFFEDKVHSLFYIEVGTNIKKQKGTISLLEEWLKNKVRFNDPLPFTKMIAIFRDIHEQRHLSAHKVEINKWDDEYFEKQRELMMKAYGAIRTLRLILANHSKTKEVQVPKWLFAGKIRTY